MDRDRVAIQREFKKNRNMKRKCKLRKSKEKMKMEKETTPMHIVCVDLTEDSESEVYIKTTQKHKVTTRLRKGTPMAEKDKTVSSGQTNKSKDEDITAGKIIHKTKKKEEKDELIIVSSSSSSQDKYPELIWKSEKEEEEKAKTIRLILTNMEDDIITSEEGDVEKIRLSEILRNTKVEEEISTSGLSENTNEDEEIDVPLSFSFRDIKEKKNSETVCAMKVKDDCNIKMSNNDYFSPNDDTRIINYKQYEENIKQQCENQKAFDKNDVLHYIPTTSSEMLETPDKEGEEKNRTYSSVKEQQKKNMKSNKKTKKVKPICTIEIPDDEHTKEGIFIGGFLSKSNIEGNVAQYDEKISKEKIQTVKNAKRGGKSYDTLSVLHNAKDTPTIQCSSVFTKTDNSNDSFSESATKNSNINITEEDEEKDNGKDDKGEGNEHLELGGPKRLFLKEEEVIYDREPQMTEKEEENCICQDDKKVAETKENWCGAERNNLAEQIGYMEDETTLSGFPNDVHVIPQKEDLLLPSKFNAKVIALDTPSGLFMETNMEEEPGPSVLMKKENLKIHMNWYKKQKIKAKILTMFPNLKKYCSSNYDMKVTFNDKANLGRLHTKMFWCRCTCKISRLFNLVTKKSRSLVGLVFYIKCRRHAILQPLCRFARLDPEE